MSRTTLPAVWINGTRLDAEQACVSVRDRGLTLADGLFETMRVRRGRLFRVHHHLQRLEHGLAVLRIPRPPALRDWLHEAEASLGGGDASVRLTVTRGQGPGGLAPPADARPTVIIVAAVLPEVPVRVREAGLTAVVASGRRNPRAMTAGLKTLAFTDSVAALLEAQAAGADEAIFLDSDGHCSEATASNLFVYRGGTLLTPPIRCGALPGITRAAVLELAADARIATAEREILPDELATADEAFLTSSLRGLAPLVRLDGRPIGAGVPGALTRQLRDAYTALVERETGAA